MTYPLITESIATDIKRRIWFGETWESIGAQHGISTALVGMISTGQRWGRAKWPDGTSGKLAEERKTVIAEARREVARETRGRVKKKLREGDEA